MSTSRSADSSGRKSCGSANRSSQQRIYGVAVAEYVMTTMQEGRKGLEREYKRLLTSDFTINKFAEHKNKVSYVNVACFDHSRVGLKCSGKEETDFIHASYCYGKKFILTQNPATSTIVDFWRMIWQTKVYVIVSLGGADDSEYNFWPQTVNRKMKTGALDLRLMDTKHQKENKKNLCDIHQLKIRSIKKKSGEKKEKEKERTIQLIHYKHWPDNQLPRYNSVIALMKLMWESEKANIQRGSDKNQPQTATVSLKTTQRSELTKSKSEDKSSLPPTVIQCSSGVLGSGTFAAICVCCEEIDDKGTFDLSKTVSELRRNRFGCLEGRAQYAFAYMCVFLYAVKQGLIRKQSLSYQSFVKALEKQNL